MTHKDIFFQSSSIHLVHSVSQGYVDGDASAVASSGNNVTIPFDIL